MTLLLLLVVAMGGSVTVTDTQEFCSWSEAGAYGIALLLAGLFIVVTESLKPEDKNIPSGFNKIA